MFGISPSLQQSRLLFAKHEQLDQILARLQEKAGQGGLTPQELESQLAAARACIPLKDECISKQDLAVILPECCPLHATGIAQKVFDIPELLEAILHHLTMAGLLAVQHVNRQFRDAIDSSPKLQRQLSLAPHLSKDFFVPLGHFYFPFSNVNASSHKHIPLLEDDSRPKEEKKRTIHVVADFGPIKHKVGTRFWNMLFVQPPIKEFTAFTDCCHAPETDDDEFWREGIPIYCSSGITLGHLLDMDTKLKDEHLHCANAPPYTLDPETGHVAVKVTFQARIVLHDGDPILREREERRASRKRSKEEDRKQTTMMEKFAAAKQDAIRQGNSIPNFFEWRQTYVPEEEPDDQSDESDEDWDE